MRSWALIQAFRAQGPVGVVIVSGEPGPREPSDPLPAREGLSWWHVRTRAPVAWISSRAPFRALRSSYDGEAQARLDETMREFGPDLVIFEESHLAGLAAAAAALPARVVYDAHNVECDNQRRLVVGGPFLRLAREAAGYLALRAAERELVRVADTVLVCSEGDAEAIRAGLGETIDAVVLPSAIDTASYARPAGRARPAGPTLLFPASFDYAPNREAAQYLALSLLPKVRARFPGARLALVGRAPDAAVRALGELDGVVVTGPVEDTRPYFWDADILVCPLEYVSGTQLKLIEAFAAGVPVVTCPAAARALGATPGSHCLVAARDTIESEVARLLSDPALGQRLATSARELAAARFSLAALERAVAGWLAGFGATPLAMT